MIFRGPKARPYILTDVTFNRVKMSPRNATVLHTELSGVFHIYNHMTKMFHIVNFYAITIMILSFLIDSK